MSFSKKQQKKMNAVEQYSEVFDLSGALSSVGGDREFLAELVGLVQAAWPTLMADIRAGIARKNLAAVETTARLAKAAARYVSAKRAHESALRLENAARLGDLPAAQRAGASLELEVETLQLALTTLESFRNSP